MSFFRRDIENNVIYYLFKGRMVGYPKGIKVKMDVKGLSLTKVRSSTEEDGKAGRFDEAKRASAMMSWPFERTTSTRNDLERALSFALDCMSLMWDTLGS